MTTEHVGHEAPTNIEYIQHHLSHLKSADGAYNLDTFWVSAILGLIFLGVFWLAGAAPPPACRASCKTSSKP